MSILQKVPCRNIPEIYIPTPLMLIESSGKNSKFNEREIFSRQNHTLDRFMSGLV